MIVKIRTCHEFADTYGSPRVWLELRRQGVYVGRKRVERIMREHGLQGAFLRKGWKGGSTKQNPHHTAAPDLVDRQFDADEPNRLWVADLTRIVTGEGVLWLASMRDAFSNKVVGWATAARADTSLVLTALDYALRSRSVQDGGLIHHSDKGSQGGFNWSSQHPLISEVVDDGGGGLEQEDQRCAGGCASAVARGSGAASRDALARAA